MKAHLRGGSLLVTVVALTGGACQEPTQAELRLSTDLPCDQVHGTTVTVGRRGELEEAFPATSLAVCEVGDDGAQSLGFVVLVPRGASDEAFAVKVVTAVTAKAPDECQPGKGGERGYRGCIVARREGRYLSGRTLRMAVPMLRQCEGVECTADSTCFDATTCLPAGVTCHEDGCVVNEASEYRFPNPAGPGDAAGTGGTGGGAGRAGASGGGGAGGEAGATDDGGTGGSAGADGSHDPTEAGGGGAGGRGGAGGIAGSGGGASCGSCSSPPGPCYQAVGVCLGGSCVYALKPSGTSCDDGDLCTQSDKCDSAGTCKGTPLACTTPPGQCYQGTGICSNGVCNYAPKPADTSCNDNNACTTDMCDGMGTCIATSLMCTTPPGQCYQSLGSCSGGVCSYQPKTAGTPCNDGSACTTGDVCNGAGTCGGAAIVCNTPPGQCYQSAGTCSGGSCVYAPKPQGAGCNDGNACTAGDVCNGAGTCGGAAIVCNTPPGQCYENVGTCAAGTCTYNIKPNDTPCDDGVSCTNPDFCHDGACLGLSWCEPWPGDGDGGLYQATCTLEERRQARLSAVKFVRSAVIKGC